MKVEPVEWQTLLNVLRSTADVPQLNDAMALSVSSPSSDAGAMFRYSAKVNFTPNGFNFEQWVDDQFDESFGNRAESTDEAALQKHRVAAHQRLVDNPPCLYIVHDMNVALALVSVD